MTKQYFSLVEPWQSPRNPLHRAALSAIGRFNRLLFETTPGAFVLSVRIVIDECNREYSRCDSLAVTVAQDDLADDGRLLLWVSNRVANIAIVKIFEVRNTEDTK